MIDRGIGDMLGRIADLERQIEQLRTVGSPLSPIVNITASGAFAASTASLTAATLATISISPAIARNVIVLLEFGGYNTNNNGINTFGAKVDAGAVTTMGQTQQEAAGGSYLRPFFGYAVFLAATVTAGSHTITITWNVNAGTAVYTSGSAHALELQ